MKKDKKERMNVKGGPRKTWWLLVLGRADFRFVRIELEKKREMEKRPVTGHHSCFAHKA